MSTTVKGKTEVPTEVEVAIEPRAMPEEQYVLHSAWEQRSPDPQAVLHAPQWVALVCVLTQAPPQLVMQPVLQIPLLPQTPRSSGAVEEQTAQVGPQASV